MLSELGHVFDIDDPYRTTDHNEIVDGSVDLDRAWPSDHDALGRHEAPRWEKGIAAFQMQVGGAWVVTQTGGGVSASVSTSGGVTYFEITVADPFPAPESWGVIGQFDDGRIVPEVTTWPVAKTTTRTRLALNPSDTIGSGRLIALVVGARRAP